MDQPENIERILTERINSYLELAQVAYLSTHPAEIAKGFIRPYLDGKLATDFPHHDPGNFYYVDDGPINFEEHHTRRMLLGPVDDPRAHAATSYCRAVRQALMNQGLANDVYMSRPDLLAMSLPRNAAALARLAEFLNDACQRTNEETNGLRETRRDAAYEPAIRWNQDTPAAWQGMGELTEGMTDNARLADAIDKMGDYVTQTFKFDDYFQSENPLQNYNFIQQPGIDPKTDVDHPARALLREAIFDLWEAKRVVDKIDELNGQAEANIANNIRLAEKHIRDLEREGASKQFLDAMKDHLEREIRGAVEDILVQEHYFEVADMVRNDISGNALSSCDAFEQTYDHPQRTALYDQALRRLAHADFNLQLVHQSGALRRMPAPTTNQITIGTGFVKPVPTRLR